MAQTVINLSDPIATWVTKSNTISTHVGDITSLSDSAASLVAAINAIDSDLGDRTALTTAVTTSLVGAINSLSNRFLETTDSADIKALFATTSGAGGITLDSGSGGSRGLFTLNDSAVTTAKLDVSAVTEQKIATDAIVNRHLSNNAINTDEITNLAVTNGKIANSTITSSKFSGVLTTTIKDAAGTTLRTIYSPGS